ncbi:hypothetical protein Hanom_Chr02g00173221 [Helianthus anomalus]
MFKLSASPKSISAKVLTGGGTLSPLVSTGMSSYASKLIPVFSCSTNGCSVPSSSPKGLTSRLLPRSQPPPRLFQPPPPRPPLAYPDLKSFLGAAQRLPPTPTAGAAEVGPLLATAGGGATGASELDGLLRRCGGTYVGRFRDNELEFEFATLYEPPAAVFSAASTESAQEVGILKHKP